MFDTRNLSAAEAALKQCCEYTSNAESYLQKELHVCSTVVEHEFPIRQHTVGNVLYAQERCMAVSADQRRT